MVHPEMAMSGMIAKNFSQRCTEGSPSNHSYFGLAVSGH